nr:uncharacterized protein LOC116430620 [Nomia melanderi]
MLVEQLQSFTTNGKRKTMKCLLLLAFVAVAAAQLSPQEKTDIYFGRLVRTFNLTRDDVKNCVKTTNTTEDDILYAVNDEDDAAYSERVKRVSCLLACCAKKQGTMVGMKLNVPKIMEVIANSKLSIPLDQMEIFRDRLNACNAEVKEENNECVAIYQLHVCYLNKNPDIVTRTF